MSAAFGLTLTLVTSTERLNLFNKIERKLRHSIVLSYLNTLLMINIIAVIKERNIACTNIAVLNKGFLVVLVLMLSITHLKYFCFSRSKRKKTGESSTI